MESFADEIILAVYDKYVDSFDEKEMMDILYYLYHTTTDDNMKRQIIDIFNEKNYCIECGNKMEKYQWSEPHDETDPTSYEEYTVWDCPYCGDTKYQEGLKKVEE